MDVLKKNALYIGAFSAVVVAAVVILRVIAKKKRRDVALNPNANVKLQLIEKIEVSHDTRRFRFALPTAEHVLGLPVGQHVSFSYTDPEGKMVVRSYTPTSSDDEVGYVDFVIKVYFRGVHPKFPDGGKLTQHLESLRIGDTIDVRGPKGKLTYLGGGRFSIKERPNDPTGRVRVVRRLGMIAGGSGITPMLQIANAILKDKSDRTEVSMLYANQTERDILLREMLDSLGSTRLRLWYTIDRTVEPDWKYSVGFVNKDMLSAHMPPPGPDTLILVCGPPAMWQYAVEPNLQALGYASDMAFLF